MKLFYILLLTLSTTLHANSGSVIKKIPLKLPAIISSNMVLQQAMPVRIWGWGPPGKKLTLSFAGQKVSTIIGADSKWTVSLSAMSASKKGRNMEISVEGGKRKILKNILVGEVWLCAGQSNMWHPMSRSNTTEKDFIEEPDIRLFRVKLDLESKWEKPQNNCKGYWSKASHYGIMYFSAVGYFFGKFLAKELDVPVGLIRSAIGDSMAEAWTSNDTVRNNPVNKKYMSEWDAKIADYDENKALKKYNTALAAYQKKKRENPKFKGRKPRKPLHPIAERNRPSRLYNGYIAPLTPLAIRGVIWYQGEANSRRPQAYSSVFPDLIKDWRKNWKQPDMPFLFVQLPNFGAEVDAVDLKASWSVLREAQADALAVPNTAMAITIDVGEAKNIHPRNKKTVGERLAVAALATVYHKKVGVYSGPLYKSHKVVDNKIEISFKYSGKGIEIKSGKAQGFFIAGSDGKFYKANVEIISKDKISVWSEKVSKPENVRYAWAGNPKCNLQNKAGLPASPFRTDRK